MKGSIRRTAWRRGDCARVAARVRRAESAPSRGGFGLWGFGAWAPALALARRLVLSRALVLSLSLSLAFTFAFSLTLALALATPGPGRTARARPRQGATSAAVRRHCKRPELVAEAEWLGA